MREIVILKEQAGRRTDKFLLKYLNGAPSSFIYKMLRKKNITLNGKKADGSEILSAGDVIKMFLSDDTIDKFTNGPLKASDDDKTVSKDISKMMPPIIYEDDNIIIADKPKGMLSQKAEPGDISFNEIALSYLKSRDFHISNDFTPSICNRLDRNTEGLIVFAKTYQCARNIGAALNKRTLHKYYRCIVKGETCLDTTLKGYLLKDPQTNTVKISEYDKIGSGSEIYTKVRTVWSLDGYSELEILLLTGKTHQIRAHLAGIGYPIIGDPKYGDASLNRFFKQKFKIEGQMLIACRIVMPEFKGELESLSFMEFTAPVPDDFIKVRKYVNVEDKRTQGLDFRGSHQQNK